MSPNRKLDALKSDIVAILSSCGENKSLKRKKIISKCINESKLKDLNKSEVKKALKELVKIGRVKELGEDGGSCRYMICPDEKDSESSGGSGDSGSSSEDDDSQDKDEPLPFAEMMRKRAGESTKADGEDTNGGDSNGSDDKEEDIDDEIRRLEAELAADSDDDSSDYSGGGSDDESIPYMYDDEREGKSKRKISFGPSTEYTDDRINDSNEHVPSGGGIIRSNLEAERIAPLPKSALPQMKRRKLKGIDADVDGDGDKEKKKKKKSSNKDDENVNEGLREAVKEVLSGYEARSHERIPFYCRVCSVQSKDMESFLAHKNTDFHKAAVKAERKATYCQACRKQFTSPVQMEEHLNSKPHHERMIYLRSKNHGGGGGGRGGRGAGRFGAGRGRFGTRSRDGSGYSGRGRGNSRAGNRQWC